MQHNPDLGYRSQAVAHSDYQPRSGYGGAGYQEERSGSNVEGTALQSAEYSREGSAGDKTAVCRHPLITVGNQKIALAEIASRAVRILFDLTATTEGANYAISEDKADTTALK